MKGYHSDWPYLHFEMGFLRCLNYAMDSLDFYSRISPWRKVMTFDRRGDTHLQPQYLEVGLDQEFKAWGLHETMFPNNQKLGGESNK